MSFAEKVNYLYGYPVAPGWYQWLSLFMG